MRRSRQAQRRLRLAGGLLLVLLPTSVTTAAATQTNEHCFAETDHCISRPIRTY